MPHKLTHTAKAAAAHAFKGLADWIEVFKAGAHTDSKGTACTFTTGDLDQMVANVSLGKPPAVLGHPKHDDPAFGWADLKREGDTLFAKFGDVNPAFEAGVAQGAYRNRSVAVVKDKAHGWRVRHIGWLGAAPPAIDGLRPVQFSAADDAEAHEFSSGDDERITGWALDDIAATLRALREATIADKGLEEADRMLPEWRISSVSSAAAQLRELAAKEAAEDPPAPLFNAPPGDPRTMLTPEDLERAAQEAAAKATAETEAKFAAQAEELKKLQSERQGERIQAQITGWKAEGKLLPAQEAGLAEFMAAIEDGGFELTFAAPGTNTPSKKPAVEFFAEFMGRLAPQIKLGKQGNAQDDTPPVTVNDPNALAVAAQEFMAAEGKAGRTVTLAAAIGHVQRANQP